MKVSVKLTLSFYLFFIEKNSYTSLLLILHLKLLSALHLMDFILDFVCFNLRIVAHDGHV